MSEFIIAVLLGMILHGLVRNLVAEADAKAYEFIVPDVDIEYLEFSGYSGYASAGGLLCEKRNLCPSWTDVPVPGADQLL